MRPATYKSQRWLFEIAVGRSEIDLSISGMAARDTADLLRQVPSIASYGLDRGTPQLRALVAEAYGVTPDHVMITTGSQEATYLLMAATLEPGDRVVVHTPGWQQLTHLPESMRARTTLVPIGAAEEIELTGIVEAAAGARMIVLNTPHNPTGLEVTDPAQWQALADAVAGTDTLVVNDEEYVTDFADSVVHRIPGSCSVGSLSKVYGFAGLRTGWLVGPPEIIEACVNYRRYTTISNSPILEAVAVQVLQDRKRYVTEYKDLMAERVVQFDTWAKEQPWLRVRRSHSAPFVLADYDLPGTGWEHDDQAFCERLLDEAGVLLMPGSVFGAVGTVRITYFRSPEVLADGLDRISRVVAALPGQ